jgi:hypothetical protein
VPYGTLLCVSDKPLHGEIKLPGMANTVYCSGTHGRQPCCSRNRRMLARQRRRCREVAFQ